MTEPRTKTPEEIAQMIKGLIEKDGGFVISTNIFQNVLTLMAQLWSLPQLERFLNVGKEMGLILEGNIEKNRLVLILRVVMNRNGVMKLK